MGVERLNIFLRILVSQLNHWTLYTFAFLYFIVHHARSENASLQVGVWLVFGVVPLGLCVARLYINKTWLFWMVHVFASRERLRYCPTPVSAISFITRVDEGVVNAVTAKSIAVETPVAIPMFLRAFSL